jgi:hypothetical protein
MEAPLMTRAQPLPVQDLAAKADEIRVSIRF